MSYYNEEFEAMLPEEEYEGPEGSWESEESEGSWEPEGGMSYDPDYYGPDDVSIEDRGADAQVAHFLDIREDAYSLSVSNIQIKDIVIPTPLKDSRSDTYLGLSKSISSFGVLSPIHVMMLEGYKEAIEEGDDTYEGPKYILLDGLRRVFGASKNGLKNINAVIWDFSDPDKGADALVMLSMILNKSQRRNWAETWYLYQILENQSSLSSSTFEYLLQLESGEALKLKEVMTRADDFPDPKDDLIAGKKSLQQAYSALMKQMKEVDKLFMEDTRGMGDMDQADGVASDGNTEGRLSDSEVRELLDMQSSFDGELSDEDFDELAGNNLPADRQTPGDRRPLDPALRAAVLARDGYCCQVTGRGRGLPAPIALSILNVHHKIPVHAGGTDEMDNLITISLDVHTLVHIIENNGGKVGMSKEQFDSLDEEGKLFIKGCMKLARIAVSANQRVGRKREQIRQDNSNTVRFKMPGVVQRENMEAVASSKVD